MAKPKSKIGLSPSMVWKRVTKFQKNKLVKCCLTWNGLTPSSIVFWAESPLPTMMERSWPREVSRPAERLQQLWRLKTSLVYSRSETWYACFYRVPDATPPVCICIYLFIVNLQMCLSTLILLKKRTCNIQDTELLESVFLSKADARSSSRRHSWMCRVNRCIRA